MVRVSAQASITQELCTVSLSKIATRLGSRPGPGRSWLNAERHAMADDLLTELQSLGEEPAADDDILTQVRSLGERPAGEGASTDPLAEIRSLGAPQQTASARSICLQ